jgi:PAS domain S-box-containing protein
VLACFLDESAREYFPKEIDANSIVGVYGANFILISSLIFGIQIYFLNGMKKNKIELAEKEMLLEASTEIEKQKELLIASKDRLELVMGSLEEVVWGRNLPDYQLKYVSNSVVNLYGLPIADWYENPNIWSDMIHPDDLAQVEKEGESLFTRGITELEYRIITADKEIKWIHSTTRIIKSTDGKSDFMTGIAKDITEEKKVQNQLNQLNNNLEVKAAELQISNSDLLLNITEIDVLRAASESVAKELRQFIETANAPIFGIDAKGNVNEWNQSSEKITGFKKEEVLGKDLVETYITDDYREAVKLVLDNALKGKETANFEFPLFSKDNQRVMVLLNSSTRRNADGEITGVLGVGQDISEIDKLRSDLEDTVKKRTFELENSLGKEKELGKLKTSFVAMASHEFRTPLTAIQAAADVILKYKDKLSQEDIKKRLFKIKREVRDMTIMLEDILIIGKADSQKLEFNAIEQDLVVLVKNIVSDYQLTQVEVREVIYKISRDKIMLNADPKWIKHIIINLLSNAVKYSEAPTSITIEIRQEENEVILSVTDQGIGISKKEKESIFDPFHRGKNVGNIQGTGLGLSVLQTAIDLHKGKIKVESKLNNGSTFIVYLPYEGTI